MSLEKRLAAHAGSSPQLPQSPLVQDVVLANLQRGSLSLDLQRKSAPLSAFSNRQKAPASLQRQSASGAFGAQQQWPKTSSQASLGPKNSWFKARST